MRNYKQKFKEYKDFLYPLFILGTVLLLLKVFFLPKFSETLSLRKRIETEESKIQEQTSYLSYLQTLASSSLEIEEGLINYALPEEKDIISLIITYEGLGKMEGITLSPLSLKPGLISKDSQKEKTPSGKKSDSGEISFKMEVVAENKDLAKRFLEEIVTTRRILRIEDLKWSLDEEGKVKLDLSLVTYYLPSVKAPAVGQLLEAGRGQSETLERLKKTKIYEEEILEVVPIGKEDLFSL